MFRLILLSREVSVALLLGAATLIFNSGIFAALDGHVRLGDIFLFLAAQSLGLRGALIALAVGILPETLQHATHFHFLRLLGLASLLGFASDRYPRVPGFILASALWCVVFGPLMAAATSAGLGPDFGLRAEELNALAISFYALTEITLITVAGAVCLNPSVMGILTLRARPLTLERLLVHVLALVGTIICCLAIRALGMHGLASAGNAAVALTLMIGSIILPALIGWRLAALIKSRWQELFPKAMLSNTSSTFSGLSADFWRRRQTHTSSGSEGSKSSALINLTSIGIKPAALPEGSKSLGEGRAQGICALSREGTVTYVNRKFCALAEIKSAEILGRTLEQINMNPELRAQATQLVEATYQRGPKRLELKLGEPNHNLRFLELESQFAANLESATLPAGPDALILTLRDITDRRTVEATLFAAQRHTTLGRLVAGIAHDFNNALTTIIGHASIARQLARDAALPVQNEHLGSILAAAQGAAEQTRHLMDFSQNAHVPTTVMDLTTYIPEKLGLLKGMSERGCAINYQGPKESLAVIAEQNLVLQAVLCLIDGAVERYKGNGGSIEVSLEREEIEEDLSNLHPSARPGKFARVRIRDEAPGMTPDTLKKALDPLADHSAPMQQSLPIAFAIVRAHDGFLTAESKLEQGTSISLYFPLASTEAREKKQSAAARQTSSFQGKQTCSSILEHAACEVLIVEDDLPVREMISKLTTHLGYSVRSCACAREALEKLHEKPVRLLITDQTLPGLSGRDLAQQFQQESPDTAVLLVSGYSMLSEEHFEDTPNSVPVLSKPFDMDSLAEAIQSALSQRAGVMAKPGAN